jgi:hypothetical protein
MTHEGSSNEEGHHDMSGLESSLEALLATLAPQAVPGLLAATALIALSRLPLVNVLALAAAGACLGAHLASGEVGLDVGMAVTVAGVAAALALIVSGGSLWRRPGVRALLAWTRRARGEQAAQPAEVGEDTGGLSDSLGYRLAAVAAVALAARALSPLLSPALAAQEGLLVLWLAGMGLATIFSQGSALVSASGAVTAVSAATLLVPVVIGDVTQAPMAYRAICVLMILAALGYALAARRGASPVAGQHARPT